MLMEYTAAQLKHQQLQAIFAHYYIFFFLFCWFSSECQISFPGFPLHSCWGGKWQIHKEKRKKNETKETAALLRPLIVYSWIRSISLLIEFPGNGAARPQTTPMQSPSTPTNSRHLNPSSVHHKPAAGSDSKASPLLRPRQNYLFTRQQQVY